MNKIMTMAIALALAGCGGNGALEPEYTGCATDEAWRTFDDQEPLVKPDNATAPLVTMPAPSTTVPYASKVKLTWQPDASNVGTPDGNVLYAGPNCNMCCRQFNMGGLTTFHLPPISGEVYDLQFRDGNTLIWRVITTFQEWTPDDKTDAWKTMRGRTVSLTLWHMTVLRNDPPQGGGPFVGTQPFVFTVGN
jgi:hypothetical protein